MGKDDLRKGASYKPGEHPYDLKLVNEIVERCGTDLLGEYDETAAFIQSAVPKQLDYIEHFDPDAFLDAIVLGWRQNVSYMNLNQAIMSSVKGLYDAGIDTFRIDLRTIPERLHIPVPRLGGVKERPLKIRCLGEVKFFGLWVDHCHLDLEGYCQSAGEGAMSSVFRFSCPGEEMDIVALGAEDSAFYNVPSLKPTPFYRRDGGEGCIKPVSQRCRFYVQEIEQRIVRIIEENGFWRCENRLYVPDGDGGWNEIIPDGDGNWKEVPEE